MIANTIKDVNGRETTCRKWKCSISQRRTGIAWCSVKSATLYYATLIYNKSGAVSHKHVYAVTQYQCHAGKFPYNFLHTVASVNSPIEDKILPIPFCPLPFSNPLPFLPFLSFKLLLPAPISFIPFLFPEFGVRAFSVELTGYGVFTPSKC